MTSAAPGFDADLDAVWRAESRRALATLIRLLGDFDLAEEALQEAFLAASAEWPRKGVPARPAAWLISAGRFKAIDRLRRRARFDARLADIADAMAADASANSEPVPPEAIADDQLRLIFTCCHPDLPPDAQVALTLREVAGLTTEAIARAFLTSPPTVAQRIVRAKARIRDEAIPYRTPEPDELCARTGAVLRVIYLVFNEGHGRPPVADPATPDLAREAIRLARQLAELLPQPEVHGLLALMLLTDARRDGRFTPDGEMVALEDQDRSRWNRHQIAEGEALVRAALASRKAGPYVLQAAISALHATAPDAASVDWVEVAQLYTLLARAEPSPVAELNRAVAAAMVRGPATGLKLVDRLIDGGELEAYQPAHAARADLLRRLGRRDAAGAAYARAILLSREGPERRFLERRLADLAGEP